jgi:glucosamine-6-phosphate deaminase
VIRPERSGFIQVESLKVEIYPDREAAGRAAGHDAAAALTSLARAGGDIGVIFATGASQFETLKALTGIPALPWNRVVGFHMDEYQGMSPDHPASFRRYLRERLTSKVQMKQFNEVDGTVADFDQYCQEYAAKLRAANPQLCLLGIGENGHLAFNDPPVADFHDPNDMKLVTLDAECKQQQFAEGWFKTLADVPSQAATLTIPTLMRVPKLIASVPGPRKTHIVYRALTEPIATACPATLLRTHPDCTVYLDEDSAKELRQSGLSITA